MNELSIHDISETWLVGHVTYILGHCTFRGKITQKHSINTLMDTFSHLKL